MSEWVSDKKFIEKICSYFFPTMNNAALSLKVVSIVLSAHVRKDNRNDKQQLREAAKTDIFLVARPHRLIYARPLRPHFWGDYFKIFVDIGTSEIC